MSKETTKRVEIESINVDELKSIITTIFSEQVSKINLKNNPEVNGIKYLTIDQVAEKLGNCSLSTVRRATNEGRLKAYTLTGKLLYIDKEVDEAVTELIPIGRKSKSITELVIPESVDPNTLMTFLEACKIMMQDLEIVVLLCKHFNLDWKRYLGLLKQFEQEHSFDPDFQNKVEFSVIKYAFIEFLKS